MFGFMSERKVKKAINEMWTNYSEERENFRLLAENECLPGSEKQKRYLGVANMCNHYCRALTELKRELFG